ncbi:MAG: nucleotidyltransferase domain-containing protein [Candidatus Hydrogenedentes bacterium]|nr:nucleotidyltransferase domain-containing protein [Candidatus Hydrogenedentota bacterium]
MVTAEVVESVQGYLRAVEAKGIPVAFGVVYGSHAKGVPHEWSDIDLVVVSRRFDEAKDREDIYKLWRVAAETDSRIEPIACGERAWQEDDSSIIIEVARREGEKITLN